MDEQRPQRRRPLTPKEKKALEKRREKQKKQQRKQARQDAKIREDARRRARKSGQNPHLVVEIPAKPPKKSPPKPKPKKVKKKTIPDIIEKETDKRVRELKPTQHKDGFYVDEVAVRKEQAKKVRQKRRKREPKKLTPKQRRTRRIAVYTVIIALVLFVGVFLSLTVLFKAEEIVVKGNDYYEDSKITELSGVSVGDNIFTATMFGDPSDISEKLPYVKSASIGFEIPNKLIVKVENHTTTSAIKSSGSYYLVSEDQRILEKVSSKPSNLMFVDAPKLKSTEIGDYVEFKDAQYTEAMSALNDSIVKHEYKDITAIKIKKLTDITLTYDGRIVIRIGMPEKIDYKLRTAFTIINEKLDPNHAAIVRGVLDVSTCHTSKKSYWNEITIEDEEPEESSSTAEPTTEPTTVRTTFVAVEQTTDALASDPNQYFTETPIATEASETTLG